MSAPFYKFGLFGDETSLIVAFLIGIAFGFFLERAGFGGARKLAAQFYFRDMSVLKVMFTAIVTAMTGLYLLSRLGLVDLSLVYLVPTFLVPQIVGGLVLGAGFVIGGYCPGTSCVAAATGRIDGLAYVAGMFGGLAGFAEIYPRVAGWAHSTAMGPLTFAKLLDIPYGILVLAVVLMALAAFAAAEWAEGKFGGAKPGAGSLTGDSRRLTPVRGLAFGLGALGVVAAVGGSPYRGGRATVDTRDLALKAGRGADLVSAGELSGWILQGRADYRLVDLRAEPAFASYHLPGAQNVPLASLTPDFAARNEIVVLYSESELSAAQAWFLLEADGFRSVYILKGGLDAWRREVLHTRAVPAAAPASQPEAAPAIPLPEAPPSPPPAHRVRKEGC